MSKHSDNIDIQVFLVNSESILLVTFVKNILSQIYSYCARNCSFLKIFGDCEDSCFVAKICSKYSYICVFIFSTNSTASSRKIFISR